MQSITRKQIMPFTNLTCVTTDKFKTGCLAISLVTRLDRGVASRNALLPKVLRSGTSSCPDMESIAAKLDNLYGARIETVVRKKGELHAVGFYSDFIDDDFVPAGTNILENVSSFMGEMLLSPNTRGGLLLGEYVEREKSNLIDEIRAGINDKRRYSIDRLLEVMCADEAYGVNQLGMESSVKSITASALTKHYKSLISSAVLEVFYCGSADFARVQAAVLNALSALPRSDTQQLPPTDIKLSAPETAVNYKEELDVSQGKLAVGFRIGDYMKSPNYPALMVFNAVYGGCVTSKLFSNVREKLSLCYFASSAVEKHKGIMFVSSGIEFDKYDEARSEILAQLDAIKNGDIEPWELESAKRAVMTSVKTAMDSPSGLEGLYFDQAVANIKVNPDDLAALAALVTKEEIMKIADSVKLDTVYFLAGIGGRNEV